MFVPLASAAVVWQFVVPVLGNQVDCTTSHTLYVAPGVTVKTAGAPLDVPEVSADCSLLSKILLLFASMKMRQPVR